MLCMRMSCDGGKNRAFRYDCYGYQDVDLGSPSDTPGYGMGVTDARGGTIMPTVSPFDLR
jgi:hypothetical protein